jgi:hypothetical protein
MKTVGIILSVAWATALLLPAAAAEKPPKTGKLQHVVAFKFKSTATPAQIQQVEAAFCALKKKIPQVKSLEWGTNVSPENLHRGFTHCWILTFKTEADRDTYIKHPAHQAFVELLRPVLEEAFVIDFWAQK